ncbi:MAG: 4-(cytidine 5'-diphospho)-2-C-methyl-D-erythritol kinase [Planctomycetota bacterium]
MNDLKADIKVSSYAKVNLFLEICRKRDDGFHEIETVMHEVDLCDKLLFSLRTDSVINLNCNINEIPCDERNLVYKAALMLQKECRCSLGADIFLEKKIPSGGGLGGGSSNCAAAFSALNKLWNLNLDSSVINKYAADLGSDINFFLYGGTCYCTGRGEQIKKLPDNKSLDFILIFPEWGISTKEAYSSLDSTNFGKKPADNFLNSWEKTEKSSISSLFFNRFEENVFNFEKREKVLYEKLNKLPFKKVCMSGSGSTLFGVLKSSSEACKIIKSAESIDGVKKAILTSSRFR